MKIEVNYIESGEVYEMRRATDWQTGETRIVNVGGRYLPF